MSKLGVHLQLNADWDKALYRYGKHLNRATTKGEANALFINWLRAKFGIRHIPNTIGNGMRKPK